MLVDIAIGEDGLLKRPRFIAGKTIAWPPRIADQVLSAEDLLATFTEFTAASIARSIRDHIPILNEITTLIASGGGVRNAALMARLKALLRAGLRLTLSDEFGIPAQYKEAIKFAALALAAQNHLANNIPAASGASRFAILGKMVLAPRLARGVGPPR